VREWLQARRSISSTARRYESLLQNWLRFGSPINEDKIWKLLPRCWHCFNVAALRAQEAEADGNSRSE
jgi:hypothetical protein